MTQYEIAQFIETLAIAMGIAVVGVLTIFYFIYSEWRKRRDD